MQPYMILSRMGEKLSEIISYPFAWLAGLGLFIADAVTGGRLVIYLVVVASVVDLICGIAVAISRKEFTQSDLIRRTVEKLLVYGCVLIVFLCIDMLIERETTFQTDITSGVVGVIITLTEAVSFTASLIILFPRNAFLRMFEKMLKGELARKLNCDESEVDAMLAEARKRKNRKPARDKSGRFVKKANKKKCGVE